MLRKVLVANRGEIALRVIRACREMGIASVAVYSDADAHAVHVREADEAVHIGPSPSSESYLKGDVIIAAAKQTGADAIHPGYGFLSEREWFARAVRDAGLIFVGPPAEAIAAMGSKTAARALATSAGVPIVPGTTEGLKNATDAKKIAAQFGYPVLLKAAAGGGGKGMRVVADQGSFKEQLEGVGPRHVEIQVLGDTHGNMFYLNERECSVQRRHQKMIEEAPSVAVTPAIRMAMGQTAVRAAKAAGYVNAGTCEFLLDAEGKFYFLEMNTRLQVEHPVTELVTGIDLVQWQLRVAAGEKLPFRQEEIVPRGWAIECRITSEDPANGFLPSTGEVTYLHVPTGPGVRWDSGIEVGSAVGLFYDPMLAKLIVWAPTRDAAVARMRRALLELTVEGVETSRDFHLRVMEDDDFRAGRIDIQWLERRLPEILGRKPGNESVRVAAIAAALLAERDRSARSLSVASNAPDTALRGADSLDSWKEAARIEGLRS